MLNPFRKPGKPFEETSVQPEAPKYPFVLLQGKERRVVATNGRTFVIEKLITTKDALGAPSSGWLKDYEISSDDAYLPTVNSQTVYWILRELADRDIF